MRRALSGVLTVVLATSLLELLTPPVWANPCVAVAEDPIVVFRNMEFFEISSEHAIACDGTTAIIHAVGELTADLVVQDRSVLDCIQVSVCGFFFTLTTHQARHPHGQHLWHGWTEGWHKHRSGDRKRNVARKRSPNCTPAGLREIETCISDGSKERSYVQMTGPSSDVVVASGPDWTLTARVEGGEVVRQLQTPEGGSVGRGSLRRGAASGEFIDWSGQVHEGGQFWVYGMVAPDVWGVRIELNNGGVVQRPTVDASEEFSVSFYAMPLPIGARPLAIVALNEAGTELERLDASISLEV